MFDLKFDEYGIVLHVANASTGGGLLAKLFGSGKKKRDLANLPPSDRDLILALADLRALADEFQADIEIGGDHLRFPHKIAASLSSQTAEILGLPKLVDLTIRTDVEGIVGASNFRLRAEWFKNGKRQSPVRTGSILQTSDGLRRLPLWIMDALDIADRHPEASSDVDHWGALSRFRHALDPGVRTGDQDHVARVSMTDFLAGLQVRIADRFSISANEAGNDFELLPFSGDKLGTKQDDGSVAEADAEIRGKELQNFQEKIRERGAIPAYRLGPGNFLVIDQSVLPVLKTLADMQKAPADERSDFIKNPRPKITEAAEATLREKGLLDGLSPEAEEEAIENLAGPAFVETLEFSERVTGVKVFEKPDLGEISSNGTTWLPETFARLLAETLGRKSTEELDALKAEVTQALETGQKTVHLDEIPLPASSETVATIDAHISSRSPSETPDKGEPVEHPRGPIVLDGKQNLDQIEWVSKFAPRETTTAVQVPSSIRTPLKQHQVESFELQVAAWRAGMPGILNADEQGLGKTLQTIAFLVWLKTHMANAPSERRGPILVVAPTSLLENWEQEVSRHVDEQGLGHLIRLYGSAISARKLAGKSGKDTDDGTAKIDFSALKEAIEEGRGHRYWILTTYTTFTNYQHSLGRIPFSAIVYDEIQTLKNPASLRASASWYMKGDFSIGLTGTPIENSAMDLWAVMEPLASGALGELKNFRKRYGVPDSNNMTELYERLFKPVGDRQPLAFRRTKDMVAKDLPEKTRYLHPRLMPAIQASAYDDARLKLAQGGLGAALKMLHHIRSVSVHPSLDSPAGDSNFINASARLSAVFDILRCIAKKGERALVFIEHRQMQYRFIELARAEFGLQRIDLINGETAIPQRQAIVNRFQRHLQDDGGFDMLVLGPKAAGVGLTLTAATHVIHLSRWWNPAVEEQCNDRIHRIGQTRPVEIHAPIAIHPDYRENSFDCLLHSLMNRKRKLAKSALWPMGDTEDDAAELQRLLAAESPIGDGDAVQATVAALFKRDGETFEVIGPDGTIRYA